jgi:hypothetical protein
MTTQVTGIHLTSSGNVLTSPTRVRAIHYIAGATAGTLVFKNGGSSGTTILTIDTPASATFSCYLKLPGLGVKFDTTCYCAITNAAGVTVFIG